ncbi:potassium-transporting ATPase subunit F [Alishewanella longhuensis]
MGVCALFLYLLYALFRPPFQ